MENRTGPDDDQHDDRGLVARIREARRVLADLGAPAIPGRDCSARVPKETRTCGHRSRYGHRGGMPGSSVNLCDSWRCRRCSARMGARVAVKVAGWTDDEVLAWRPRPGAGLPIVDVLLNVTGVSPSNENHWTVVRGPITGPGEYDNSVVLVSTTTDRPSNENHWTVVSGPNGGPTEYDNSVTVAAVPISVASTTRIRARLKEYHRARGCPDRITIHTASATFVVLKGDHPLSAIVPPCSSTEGVVRAVLDHHAAAWWTFLVLQSGAVVGRKAVVAVGSYQVPPYKADHPLTAFGATSSRIVEVAEPAVTVRVATEVTDQEEEDPWATETPMPALWSEELTKARDQHLDQVERVVRRLLAARPEGVAWSVIVAEVRDRYAAEEEDLVTNLVGTCLGRLRNAGAARKGTTGAWCLIEHDSSTEEAG